ncbi:MAG: transposase [Candidatus Berkiella sp.]
MTLARSEQIDLNATPYYHVMNRCVRRSFLCGFDELTQKDYSHRKAWIVDRLKYLADIFAIKICAYAIMSNHYHVVLYVEDKVVENWSEAEIIRRWASIFPKDAEENKHLKQKIQLWKERLTSISWFMRCLNERIARDVNEEDDTAGRFWEGRFKSQALLDEGALLSAMVYVDLNPVRAGITKKPEESEFTSIYERIQHISKQLKINKQKSIKQLKREKADIYNNLAQPKSLVPFSSISTHHSHAIDFKLVDYLELVDYTGRIIRADKEAGSIPEHLAPILSRLQLEPQNWISLVKNLSKSFSHAVGNEILLLNFGKERKKALKGITQAKKLYSSTHVA